MSFADLKRKSQNNMEFLQKELQKSSNASSGADERLWKPELDAGGNGYAVIRFLPAPEGETLPWAKLYNHAFQESGGWLIENCPTTHGGQCPICLKNGQLWKSGDEDTARQRKRKLSYYSNILVVKDPKHPENEGRVFLYKYGKKIHDKILAAMQPEFEDETPINVFDFWEGANFKIKIKTVGGYWNYDSSEFAEPTAVSSDDTEMEEIWKKQYSLSDFTSEDKFKSYEELQSRLDTVLGKRPAARTLSVEDEEYDPAPVSDAGDFNAPDITTSSPFREKMSTNTVEDDDALSYFAKLAEE